MRVTLSYDEAVADRVRRVLAGRPLAGFICVKPAGYRNERALKAWLQRAIDFVATVQSRRVTPRRGSA